MSIVYGRGPSWSFSSSQSDNPFFNLAWENELLHGEFDGESHIFLYRNGPCVVSGRFQVPWREMNFLHPKKLTYVRRRSGGGTVYHDSGNWNFCIVHRGRELKRETNLERVISICQKMGQTIEANERFDLVKKIEGKTFKVSGSAFKQKKDFALHHGTLLVDAGLDQLKGALGVTTGWKVTGKGIASVPSPVINLKDLDYEMWEKSWCEDLQIGSLEEIEQSQRMKEEEDQLKSWAWRFGETPKHEIEVQNIGHEAAKLSIHKGEVVSSSGFPEVINLIGLKVCGEPEDKLKDVLEGLTEGRKAELFALFSNSASMIS